MKHVFASHNKLGRLCDESVYRNDIARRLRKVGLGPIHTEVPLTVSLNTFRKTYRLDLVADDSFIAELKTNEALIKQNESQLLNYEFIAGVPHGKLINLRPPDVEYRTVNAMVPPEDRRIYQLTTKDWSAQSARCDLLLSTLDECLKTWGAYLDFNLYREALIHFLGGEDKVCRRIELTCEQQLLGTQSMDMVDDQVAFEVTAIPPDKRDAHATHLGRLLGLTSLKTIQWINLHHHDIHVSSLCR